MAHEKLSTRELALRVSRQVVQLAHDNKASHIGGALSAVDLLAVLYGNVLRYDPNQSGDPLRDRFFYSKGHACTVLYALLKELGFYGQDALETFTKDGSYFTSHVNHKVPGVEWSTGSLGHALNVACGVALAGLRKKAGWKVYAMLSDGELDEGSNWEAILFAPHHRLANLTVIVDYNKIQSFGDVKDVLNLDPLSDKFRAFGWEVSETDGHDQDALMRIFSLPPHANRPRVIIAHTVKGKGVPFMENELAWHYKSPDAEQLKQALQALQNR